MSKFSGSPYSLYAALQVSEKASMDEIKKSYQALARQFHPDKNGGDDTRFKEIQEAYDILSKKEQKQLYDDYCEREISRLAEEEILRQKKEKRSAVYKTKNSASIRENLSEWLRKNLTEKFSDVWSKSFDDSLSKDLNDAVKELGEKFANSPFDKIRQKLAKMQRLSSVESVSKNSIKELLKEFVKAVPGVDTSFWKNKLDALSSTKKKLAKKSTESESGSKDLAECELSGASDTQAELDALYQHILESWNEAYEKMVMQWMISEMESAKQAMYAKYQEMLNNLRQIKRTLGTIPDLGWDLSLGNLTAQDFQVVLEWSKFFQENPKIQELCEALGHLNKEASRVERETIQATRSYETVSVDCNSNEEIVGITFGKSIEDALPQELALLGDEDTSMLFDMKFIENRLMCFEKQGYVSQRKEETYEEEREIEIRDKKGPIIVCVDTSGSMEGLPENIAKAITLHMASIAHKQDRGCYLINFSTSITTFDFKPPKGLSDLIRFLKSSFHGGTDVMPALNEGIRMMQEGGYDKSDLLVISDFIFPTSDSGMLEKIKLQREKDNYFYALSIVESSFGFGYYQNSKQEMFDEAWVYSRYGKDIRMLYSRLSKIGESR